MKTKAVPHTLFAYAPWQGRLGLIAAMYSLAIVLSPPAQAQDVKAFQNAVNYLQDGQGCRSIPYSSLEDACTRKQADVERWCKDVASSCGDADPKRLQADVERIKTDRDTLKAKKDELERARSSLTDDTAKRENEDKTKEIDNKLYELSRTRDNLERQISDATRSVNDRLYAAKACRDSRTDMYKLFNDAISSGNSDRQRGDPEIAPLAQRLVDGWTAGNRKHEEAIRNATNSVEICDKVLYEIGHLGSF